MYSRDIFPRYSSGGLPIPENYSGNAIRRTPPPGANPSGGRSEQPNGSRDRGNAVARVHTPTPRPTATQPPSRVPLTVSPHFAQQNVPNSGERENLEKPSAERAETRAEKIGADRVEEVREPNYAADSHSEGEGETETRGEQSTSGRDKDTAPVSAQVPRGHEGGGLPSILSAFLPPKPGGGGLLSQIGLEEALLLGLFLLLSQSEEEEDTLMLLALLFLYR